MPRRQYDYGEFFAVADHHDFKVVLQGSPFSGSDMGIVASGLLPVLQAAKPRPALTFAYVVAAAKDQPGLFKAYAVYCRNNLAMSETTAWTAAGSPSDPCMEELFRERFMVVWPDSHALRPQAHDTSVSVGR
ncbi:MAG: hypothetical protein HYX38_23865 [Rhodospirillales bacterium]|nr:hypothetical protein [Rhodospirillales bacterium]